MRLWKKVLSAVTAGALCVGEATIQLVEQLGGKVVGIAFLIELEALKGREKLKDYNVYSVLTY